MLRTPFVRGLAALALVHSSIALQSGLDSSQLSAIQARAIGPAGMSGRVAAIEALRSDPRVIYVGAATGGLWKTEDEALTWEPLFDDQDVASIGAIAVHPLYEDIVWVGTGEGNPRNSSSVGKGLFRSLDGGATWTHLGLRAHREDPPRAPASDRPRRRVDRGARNDVGRKPRARRLQDDRRWRDVRARAVRR